MTMATGTLSGNVCRAYGAPATIVGTTTQTVATAHCYLLTLTGTDNVGNAASIYTTSGAVASHFESRANAGMVGINIGVPVPREPFAFGGWNDSRFGIGDITGHDAISFWTKTRKVTRKWTAAAAGGWMS